MSDQNDMLKLLYENNQRLKQTETREVPGNVPGFTSFYDTGNFVPTWVGTTIAGTFTYTANTSVVEWSRIGNRLFYNGRIAIDAITVAPTGNLTIAGWPYPGVSNATMSIAGGGAMIVWTLNIAATYTYVALQATNGSSALGVVRSGDNVAPATVLGGELIAGGCWFEGNYRIG